jgi:hypothetical protein
MVVAGSREVTSTHASRWSVGALAVGASASVLVALPYKVFDLDRYFVPKELVLHLTALIAIVAAVQTVGPLLTPASGRQRLVLTRTDTLLICFLLLSAISAFSAPNRWLASRALAISASGIACFWVCQYLARIGRGAALFVAFAAAVTLAAITTLLQAYGVETEFFSINRSPGGTLGNRNFVAHIAAIGIPVLLLVTFRARRVVGVILGAIAIGLVSAAIVLSRSRAAWVATALAVGSIVPLGLGAWRTIGVGGRAPSSRRATDEAASKPATRAALVWRGTVLSIAAICGIAAAIILPNTLNWRSPSPYLDSVLGVTNYHEGSGRARVVQYTNTARLAITHPVFGVGPGNWAVVYPRVASRGDPALNTDDGMTANPWPSSDWADFAAERGLIATTCLALALVGLLVSAWRAADLAVDTSRMDRLLAALALIATVVAVVVVGNFDAVLLLPTPSLIAWGLLGALTGVLVPQPAPRATISATPLVRSTIVAIAVAGLGIAVVRSIAQVTAMALYSTATGGGRTSKLELAARADPGSYRIHMRLAEDYIESRLCTHARPQASAARALYPNAPEPRHILAECSGRPAK